MDEGVAPASSTPSLRWRWARRVAAALTLVILAILADRLTHIPSSSAFNLANRHRQVAVGHLVSLSSIAGDQLITVETAAGHGAKVEASAATLDAAADASPRPLAWVVGGAGDNKVRIAVGLASSDHRRATVLLQRVGDASRPSLLIGSPDVPLTINGGVEYGDARQVSRSSLVVDGATVADAPITAFTVPPGGNVALTFPDFAGTASMRVRVGQEELRGDRLWIERLAISADGESRPWWSACAAPPGRTLWSFAARTTAAFRASDCTAPHALAIDDLTVDSDTITLALIGSAYVIDRDQPIVARWFVWIRNNPIFSIVMGSLLTSAATWLVKTVRTG